MVTKSKLKMGLLGEKPVDFKKQHQKKVAKLARKEKAKKGAVVEEADDGEGWEDEVDDEEEEDLESGEEDEKAMQVGFVLQPGVRLAFCTDSCYRLLWRALTTVIALHRLEWKITMVLISHQRMKRTYPCLI